MNDHDFTVEQQLSEAVRDFQEQTTGHRPGSVRVILSEDTLVITLHEALTPAEKALASSALGAAQVQEFHRQLFTTSSEALLREIKRITGREVLEGTAEVESVTGSAVHAFTTGTVVQVFQLTPLAVATI